MENKLKHNLLMITFGVILFVALSKFDITLSFISNIFDIVLPVIVGATIAFILSVPMKKFEQLVHKLCSRLRKQPSDTFKALVSFGLTVGTLILILVLVGIAIVPKVLESITEVYNKLADKWPEWSLLLNRYGINTANINFLDKINISEIIGKYSSVILGVLSTIAGKTSSLISLAITVFSALVITLHISISKKTLSRQIKKLLYANIRRELVDKIVYIARLVKTTYTKFLTGQFIESLILGGLMFITLSIFRIEYAGLIAILTSICAFVPYIGAFLSCGVAVILTLLSSPQQALVCFIVYEVVQFIENQFIYPKVVGDSVGMSPLLTFLAVLMGGKLLGLVGILFFIPLTAVVYTLLKDNTNRKLQERNIDIN